MFARSDRTKTSVSSRLTTMTVCSRISTPTGCSSRPRLAASNRSNLPRRLTSPTPWCVRPSRSSHARVLPLALLDVAGAEYLATVVHQVGRDGGTFFVLYAAPVSDFMGPLAHAAARNILAALAVFLLALPALIYFARSISRPLARLSEEAELIQTFQLAAPIKMKSSVREVHTLIRSMSGMKSAIREVSKFVPKALVRELLQSEGSVEVGGTTRRVSILFSDIRDFTQIAESMPPEAPPERTCPNISRSLRPSSSRKGERSTNILAMRSSRSGTPRFRWSGMNIWPAQPHSNAVGAAGPQRALGRPGSGALAYALRGSRRRCRPRQCRIIRSHRLHGDRRHREPRIPAGGAQQVLWQRHSRQRRGRQHLFGCVPVQAHRAKPAEGCQQAARCLRASRDA